jgi:hypothetical protein
VNNEWSILLSTRIVDERLRTPPGAAVDQSQNLLEGDKVNLRKRLGLTSIAILVTIGLIGASSAIAGSTALCTYDPLQEGSEVCSSPSLRTHVHETSVLKGKILSSVLNVECDVLFLGDTLWNGKAEKVGLGSPLVLEGNFTYTNCNSGCEVKEVGGSSLVEILRTGHETAGVTGEDEFNVHCGFFINCTYNGEGLEGTAKGFLLSSEETINGETFFEGQELHRVSGFCPEKAALDLTTEPLLSTFITK